MDTYRDQSSAKAVLISSESFIHATATDIGVVAQRIKAAFSPCKIIITIREQLAMIRSFYGLHGRFGQYLFLMKTETERVRMPLSMDEWLNYEFRAYNQNLLATLHYYEVIKLYKDVFGLDNVGVFLFEEFVKDRRAYLEKFCNFLGVDLDTALQLTEGRHELSNLRTRELAFYNFLAKYLPNWDLPRANLIRKFLSGSPKAAIQVNRAWHERIAGLYTNGNRKLANEFALRLDEFGYFL